MLPVVVVQNPAGQFLQQTHVIFIRLLKASGRVVAQPLEGLDLVADGSLVLPKVAGLRPGRDRLDLSVLPFDHFEFVFLPLPHFHRAHALYDTSIPQSGGFSVERNQTRIECVKDSHFQIPC